jgi:hypothetical protein
MKSNYYNNLKQIIEEDSKETQAMIVSCRKTKEKLIQKYKFVKPKPQPQQ